MFVSKQIHSLFQKLIPSFEGILEHINNLELEKSLLLIQEIINELNIDIEDNPDTPDEVLNELYILKRLVDIFTNYTEYWRCIVYGEFSESWVKLQNCIDYLKTVNKFVSRPDSIAVAFFENQLLELEKLYPYNVFFSIGVTVEMIECSICGKDIDSLDCQHYRGELYRGKMALGIVRNTVQCDHIAMVKHPADKRCVVTYENGGSQFNAVRYLSNLVNQKALSPLSFHHLDFKKIKIMNPDAISQGRNDLCACSSEKKFKKCCSDKEFIEKDHMDIIGQHVDINTIFA